MHIFICSILLILFFLFSFSDFRLICYFNKSYTGSNNIQWTTLNFLPSKSSEKFILAQSHLTKFPGKDLPLRNEYNLVFRRYSKYLKHYSSYSRYLNFFPPSRSERAFMFSASLNLHKKLMGRPKTLKKFNYCESRLM